MKLMGVFFNCFLLFLLGFSIVLANDIVKDKPPREILEKRVYHAYEITLTAYSPCHTETDSTPNKTALLEKPKPGWTCAVSRDLVDYLGKKVYILGYGVFRVNDLMNKRFKKRVDLCMGKKDAKKFGKKENIKIVFF